MTNTRTICKVVHTSAGPRYYYVDEKTGYTSTSHPNTTKAITEKEVTKGVTSDNTVSYMTSKGWHAFDSLVNAILFWKH